MSTKSKKAKEKTTPYPVDVEEFILFGQWLLSKNPRIIDPEDDPPVYEISKETWLTMYELYCLFEEDVLGEENGINDFINGRESDHHT